MRKLMSVFALLFGMLALGAAPASAGYTGENPDGAVLDSTVRAGETVTFVADCFQPGTLVTVSVSGPASASSTVTVAGGSTASNVATGNANATGDITAYIVPSKPGKYTITATGTRSVCGSGAAEATFTVRAAQAAAPVRPGSSSGELADTGADGVTSQLWMGLALLGVGASIVALTVVRRRSANS